MRTTPEANPWRGAFGRWRLLSVGLAFAMFAALGAVTAGAAERSEATYQNEFNKFSETIGKLADADGHRATNAEIEQLRTWLGQAQALFASEQFEAVDRVLDSMDALAEFTAIKQRRVKASAAAAAAEKRANVQLARTAKVKKAVAAAQAMKTKLEAEGL